MGLNVVYYFSLKLVINIFCNYSITLYTCIVLFKPLKFNIMNKENLMLHIDSMTDEQISFLGNLLNFANFPDFQLLIKLSGITEQEKSKIDSAIPCDYAKAIRDIYPDFNKGRNVYNYNENHYGSMLNLNNVVIENIKKVLTLNTL